MGLEGMLSKRNRVMEKDGADKAVADKAVADKMEVQTDKRNSQDRT